MEVEGALRGPTADGEGTDEDAGLVSIDRLTVCSARREIISNVVDGELHLRQGVLQVEGKLVLLRVTGLHQVHERETNLNRIRGLVNGGIVARRIAGGNTPEEVDRSSRIGINHILDDRVTRSGVLVDRDDVLLLLVLGERLLISIRLNVIRELRNDSGAGRGLKLGPRRIGEEGHIVRLIGLSGIAVLVRPVLDGLIGPLSPSLGNLLVVHEVRPGVVVILLAGSIVSEDTEADSANVIIVDVVRLARLRGQTFLRVNLELDAFVSGILLRVHNQFFSFCTGHQHQRRGGKIEKLFHA